MWSIDFSGLENGNVQIIPLNLMPPNFILPDSLTGTDTLPKLQKALSANPLPSPIVKLTSIGYMDHLPLWTFYWHFHVDAAELTIVEQGEGSLHIGNHVIPLHRGSVCLVPCHILHYFSSEKENPMKYYVLELDCTDPNCTLYPWLTASTGRIIRMEQYADYLFFTLDAMNAHLKKQKFCLDAEYQAAIFALASWIKNHPNDVVDEELSPEGFALSNTLRHISAHYYESITLSDLCQIQNTSPANLNRLFQRYCQMSPINYVIYYRITQALRLLQYTELAVFDVANAVGYQNQTHFSRHFSRFMGCTPASFRKQLRNIFTEFSQI